MIPGKGSQRVRAADKLLPTVSDGWPWHPSGWLGGSGNWQWDSLANGQRFLPPRRRSARPAGNPPRSQPGLSRWGPASVHGAPAAAAEHKRRLPLRRCPVEWRGLGLTRPGSEILQIDLALFVPKRVWRRVFEKKLLQLFLTSQCLGKAFLTCSQKRAQGGKQT